MEEEVTQKADKGKSTILFVLIAIVLGIIIFLQGKDSFFDPSNQVRVRPGQPAPNFTFPGLDGEMVNLTDYRGKVVFLNIWATWCTPCRQEMPSMERLYRELKGEDFEILAVSIDALGAKAVAPFMKEYELSFPALLDTGGTIQRLYGTTGIPETFIINKEGVIEQKIIGSRDWAKPEAIGFLRNLIQKPLTKE